MKKEDYVKLQKALSAAFFEKEKAQVNELWQEKTMGRIRSLGHLFAKTGYLDLFQRFVWQLAPLSCAFILILGLVITQIDFIYDYEIAKVFIEDPADFGLVVFYGN